VKIESLVFSNVVTNAWQYEQIKKPTKKKTTQTKTVSYQQITQTACITFYPQITMHNAGGYNENYI